MTPSFDIIYHSTWLVHYITTRCVLLTCLLVYTHYTVVSHLPHVCIQFVNTTDELIVDPEVVKSS